MLSKLWNRIFHSSSIFLQLVMFTILCTVLPMAVGGTILIQKITYLVERELNNSHVQLLGQYMAGINDKLYEYDDRMLQITGSTLILDELQADAEGSNAYDRGNKISQEVNKCLRLDNNTEIRNNMLYVNTKAGNIYGHSVTMLSEAGRERWYQNYEADKKNGSFSYLAIDGRTRILSLVKPIERVDTVTYENNSYGFMKLDVYPDKLFAPVEDARDYAYDVVVMDSNDRIIYLSDHRFANLFEEIAFSDLSSGMSVYKDSMMLLGDQTNLLDLNIALIFDMALLQQEKQKLQNSLLPVILLVVGAALAAAYIFTRSFSKRVARLVNKIKIAEEGNLEITDVIDGQDEIAVLDRQYNRMLVRLDQLIKTNYVQQLEKKETELKNLQLQINPHFLYNTLETISSIAATGGVFQICDLCERLGEIFRYSLGKNYGEYVTVEQELTHTRNYIFIQKARFGNKFDAFYSVEPGTEQLHILRFILQPIVENAILHGLNNRTSRGTLEISIFQEGEYLIIKIEDDGIGMMPGKTEELEAYINRQEDGTDNKKSIGVRNVNQRIKLACGQEYGIGIKSTQYIGSSFYIRLPVKP